MAVVSPLQCRATQRSYHGEREQRGWWASPPWDLRVVHAFLTRSYHARRRCFCITPRHTVRPPTPRWGATCSGAWRWHPSGVPPPPPARHHPRWPPPGKAPTATVLQPPSFGLGSLQPTATTCDSLGGFGPTSPPSLPVPENIPYLLMQLCYC
jgi:hypothetical protein